MSRSQVVVERRHLLVVSSTAAVAACSGDASMFVSPRTLVREPAIDDAEVPIEDVPSAPWIDLDGGIATPETQGWRPAGGGVDVGAISEFAVGTWRLNAGARAIIARDARGFFAYSALCTHERCLINEPDAMGVASCVCHGSRFDGAGHVMNGPATEALSHIAVAIVGGRVLVDPTTRVGDDLRATLPDPDAGLRDVTDASDASDASDVPIDRPVDTGPDVRDVPVVDVDPCARGVDVGAVTAFAMNTWTHLRAQNLVVARDTRGLFAFTSRCTHSGCTLTVVSDGTSTCPCHNSAFNSLGEVTRGPATEDLNHYDVLVCAGRVRVDTGVIVAVTTRTPVT